MVVIEREIGQVYIQAILTFMTWYYFTIYFF